MPWPEGKKQYLCITLLGTAVVALFADIDPLPSRSSAAAARHVHALATTGWIQSDYTFQPLISNI